MRTLLIGISFICYAAAAFVTAMALGSHPAAGGEDLVVFPLPPAFPAAGGDSSGGIGGTRQTGGRQVDQLERTIVDIRREMTAREAAILEQVAREQEDGRYLAAELRDTVAGLEEKLAAGDASALDRLAREQEASRAAVEDLQETIAGLRKEMARRDSSVSAGRGGAGSAAEPDSPEYVTGGREAPLPAGWTPPLPREEDGAGRVVAILGGGLFPSGRDAARGEIERAVEKVLPAIVAHPDHRIVVEGHADSVPIGDKVAGRYVDNRALSLLRAEKIALLLVEQGVLRERITVYGLGDSRPLVPNATPEGRAENRRVEIRLVPPGEP